MKRLVVNIEDLKHNINQIKNYTKEISKDNEYTVIGVVKANGYGLGLNQYAEFLVNNGIQYLAVATLEEALCLKKANLTEKILMLSPIYNNDDLEEAVKNNIVITIDSRENANMINELAQKGYNIKAHIKIDTGFGRYGFLYNDYENIVQVINSLEKNIEVEGIFSHFSVAYYKNNKHTLNQFKRFKNILRVLEENNINIKLKHICNSPAILNYPEMCLNAARIGSAFVGRVCAEKNIGLKKIGDIEATISEVRQVPKGFNISYSNIYTTKKDTAIAIIPIGHIEGYNVSQNTEMFRTIDKIRRILREVKNLFKKQKLTVEINQKRYDVVGTVRNISYSCRCNRK